MQIDYSTLVADAKGADPFAVPDGANTTTDADLVNLANANFAGGFNARIGLPDLLPSELPLIAILGTGTAAPVTFNLLCSEFQVVGFEYTRGHSSWLNQAQLTGASSGQPWYFTADVELNNNAIDPSSKVPPAVQKRIEALAHEVGAGAFSIQRLFLDLDTAILLTTPTVKGTPEGWPIWSLVQSQFMDAYFAQLQKTG